jgi:hypothetical protein
MHHPHKLSELICIVISEVNVTIVALNVIIAAAVSRYCCFRLMLLLPLLLFLAIIIAAITNLFSIIHHPAFYLKTTFRRLEYLRSQVKAYSIGLYW